MNGSTLARFSQDLASLRERLAKLAGPGAFEFSFRVPLVKVDQSRREIEGVATSERIDSHDEVLEYEGSKEAFKSWAGNIREGHLSLAVGRAVSVQADDDARRITVRARISKGAEDTWQKLLDGTLAAFSVGGSRLRSEIDKDGVRRTKKWKMTELSLVDVGANPDTGVSLVKMVGGNPTAMPALGGEMSVEASVAAAVQKALEPVAARLARAIGSLGSLEQRRESGRDKLADEACAVAVDRVALQLASGCRPLASEVKAALNAAGAGWMRCDSISKRDWSVLGPPLAKQLRTLAKGMRMATDITDLERIQSAIVAALAELCTVADLQKSRERLVNPAPVIRKDDAPTGPPSVQELEDVRDSLAEQLRLANEQHWPQQSKDYMDLSNAFFIAQQRVKRAQGR